MEVGGVKWNLIVLTVLWRRGSHAGAIFSVLLFFSCLFVCLFLAGRHQHDYATKSQALLGYKWSEQGNDAGSFAGGGTGGFSRLPEQFDPQTTMATVRPLCCKIVVPCSCLHFSFQFSPKKRKSKLIVIVCVRTCERACIYLHFSFHFNCFYCFSPSNVIVCCEKRRKKTKRKKTKNSGWWRWC